MESTPKSFLFTVCFRRVESGIVEYGSILGTRPCEADQYRVRGSTREHCRGQTPVNHQGRSICMGSRLTPKSQDPEGASKWQLTARSGALLRVLNAG